MSYQALNVFFLDIVGSISHWAVQTNYDTVLTQGSSTLYSICLHGLLCDRTDDILQLKQLGTDCVIW